MKHVIIGNGGAALSAAHAIASVDYTSPITIITPKKGRTLVKPALADYLAGRSELKEIQWLPDDFYVQTNITSLYGRAVSINTAGRSITLASGRTISYDKLLIATGSMLEGGMPDYANVFSAYRTDDIIKLRSILPKVKKVAIVGATQEGLRIADALADRDIGVTVIEKTNAILDGSVLMQDMLMTIYRKRGVTFLLNDAIGHCGGAADGVSYIETEKRHRLDVQAIIYAQEAKAVIPEMKVKKRKGIMVDGDMSTSVSSVWAAGSVAELYDPYQNKSRQFSSWTDAIGMGHVAGMRMVGKKDSFLPSNRHTISLAGKTYVSIGDTSEGSRIDVIEDVDRLSGSFARFFVKKDLLVGAVWYNKPITPFFVERIINAEISVRDQESLLSSSFDWELAALR